MKGPRPMSNDMKILRGNPGKRPINTREPEPGALSQATPREIHGDAVAVREWRRTIVPAIKSGQVTAADRAVAIGYCQLYSLWRSQEEEAKTEPHVVVTGKQNYPMPNPIRVMAHKTYEVLTKTAGDLGFTPASRSRVKVSGAVAKEVNPLEKFLRKA